MLRRLFVYGTLHPDRAPAEMADLTQRFEWVGRARVRGHLYEFGDYPGVRLDEAGDILWGDVFLVPAGRQALARLDAYEGFDPDQIPESLFARLKTKVTMADDSTCLCWIYVYHQPI